jgi:hypothetical protein
MERQSLPNATTSLILGILSVVTCICYGVIGLPLGIIAFVLGNKALKVYHENPKDYKGSGNANAGKALGVVGIILNLIFIVFIILAFYKTVLELLQDPEVMPQRITEFFW